MNALFVSYNLFCIDINDGGRQVSARNRDCLKKIVDGSLVTLFIYFSDDSKINLKDKEIALQGSTSKIHSMLNYLHGYAMITPQIEKKIIEIVMDNHIDLVFFDSSIFGHTLKKVKEKTSAKTICFMHNVEAVYSYNRVRNESILYYPMYRAYKKNERMAVGYTDSLISINRRDAEETKKLYGRFPDKVINVTFDDKFDYRRVVHKHSQTEKLELLFVGSNFQPNVQGVSWFINEVMPHVKGTLTVVGKEMELLKSDLQSENVIVIGSVNDLSEYYYKYDAIILPIFIGSGMKVKTAEAMMYGKVIFATDEALEGYKPVEKSIIRCNTKEDFIREINNYVERGIISYSEETRQEFLQSFSNDVAIKALGEVLEANIYE